MLNSKSQILNSKQILIIKLYNFPNVFKNCLEFGAWKLEVNPRGI